MKHKHGESRCESLFCFSLYSDAVYAALQQAGKAAAAEMVRASVGHPEEEDLPGGHSDGAGTQTQDVQLPGMEGYENSLQKVRKPY